MHSVIGQVYIDFIKKFPNFKLFIYGSKIFHWVNLYRNWAYKSNLINSTVKSMPGKILYGKWNQNILQLFVVTSKWMRYVQKIFVCVESTKTFENFQFLSICYLLFGMGSTRGFCCKNNSKRTILSPKIGIFIKI